MVHHHAGGRSVQSSNVGVPLKSFDKNAAGKKIADKSRLQLCWAIGGLFQFSGSRSRVLDEGPNLACAEIVWQEGVVR